MGTCGHNENVLEVRAVAADEKQDVLVLREVATILLPLHIRPDEVMVVVDQEDGRGQVIADVPDAPSRRPPFMRQNVWATGGATASGLGPQVLVLCRKTRLLAKRGWMVIYVPTCAHFSTRRHKR